jgi:hypothetical protein
MAMAPGFSDLSMCLLQATVTIILVESNIEVYNILSSHRTNHCCGNIGSSSFLALRDR